MKKTLLALSLFLAGCSTQPKLTPNLKFSEYPILSQEVQNKIETIYSNCRKNNPHRADEDEDIVYRFNQNGKQYTAYIQPGQYLIIRDNGKQAVFHNSKINSKNPDFVRESSNLLDRIEKLSR